jgi:hypothetical protein
MLKQERLELGWLQRETVDEEIFSLKMKKTKSVRL